MNVEEVLGTFSLVNNPVVLSEEEIKDVQKAIKQLQQENEQLKDNWNKLKEYVGAEWYCYDNDSVEYEVAKDILNKMQELQGSDSNDSNR